MKITEGIATLLIVSALLVASFPATGNSRPSNPPDSDGYVPIKYVCDRGYKLTRGNSYTGWNHRIIRNGKVESKIWINECVIRDRGVEIERTVRHELAHAAGWRHYEGTPQTNAAYYPR